MHDIFRFDNALILFLAGKTNNFRLAPTQKANIIKQLCLTLTNWMSPMSYGQRFVKWKLSQISTDSNVPKALVHAGNNGDVFVLEF